MGDGQHRDDPTLAETMSASFARFATWAWKIAEDPDAEFAFMEFQSLAAHARPTQQHYQQLEKEACTTPQAQRGEGRRVREAALHVERLRGR